MSDRGFIGGFGQPGVRVTERAGGADTEIRHPLRQAFILAQLILGAGVLVLLLTAIVGRGLWLLAACTVLSMALVASLTQPRLWLRIAGPIIVGVALWAWVNYAQPRLSLFWWPVWYGWPQGGFMPVNFTPDARADAWRFWPGWWYIVRAVITLALTFAFAVPAWLLSQRFGLAILFPQLDALTVKPLEARPVLPRFIRTLDTLDEQTADEQAPRPIYVSAAQIEEHDEALGNGVRKSGIGTTRQIWNVGLLSLEQWNMLKAHLDRGGRWSNRALSPQIMTDTQQRELTPLMVSAGLLKRTDSGHGKPAGFTLTNAGRAFFAHRVYDQEGTA